MGKIRIIGGTHRSRVLPVLDMPGLRPTLDRVKETLFNWLGQDLTGKSCLDLFTGSGSLAFEAVSRNAALVVMLDKEAKVVQQLRSNIALLGSSCCQLYQQDALTFASNCKDKFDIIFLDPPYQSDLLLRSLEIVPRLLKPRGLIYIESQGAIDLINYNILKQGRAGSVYYALLTCNEG